MPNTNKVLIHRKCCDSDTTDIIQVDSKVGEMAYKGLFPAANGNADDECCYIWWSHAKSVCQTVKLYYGKDDRIYMPANGPGMTFGGLLQFDDNGESISVDDGGTLEFCPNNSADCANPQVIGFTSTNMTDTHQIPIANSYGTGNGWVELTAADGLPWEKNDFDEWVDNTVLDDVYFCTEGALTGGCEDDKETDYMTKSVTICGRIYPSFLVTFGFGPYTVTDGDGSTCAGSDQCPPPTGEPECVPCPDGPSIQDVDCCPPQTTNDPHVTTFFGKKYDM